MAREFNINTVSGTETIADLETVISTTQVNLLDFFTYTELLESEDLYTLLGSANIETEDEAAEAITQSNFGKVTNNSATGTSVYGSELNILESSSIAINTSSGTATNKINASTTSLPVGKYKISISYSWSLDTTQSNFFARFSFDGTYLGTATAAAGDNYIHVIEPQDSGGGNFDGRGTDQIRHFHRQYFVDVTTAGSKSVLLQFRPETNGVEASMWDVFIEIIRVS